MDNNNFQGSSLVYGKQFNWKLQSENFILQKNVVVGFGDQSCIGVRTLLTLFLSVQRNRNRSQTNEEKNNGSIISPQLVNTIYSHPDLPSQPILLTNFSNISFVIINTNLENESGILLASALCQMFVKHCVENVIVIAGLRLSFSEAQSPLSGSLPLYSLTLFTKNPLMTKTTSHPLPPSTSLGDSFLASLIHFAKLDRISMTLFCVPSYKHKPGALPDHTIKGIEVLSSVITSLFKENGMNFSREVLYSLKLSPKSKSLDLSREESLLYL